MTAIAAVFLMGPGRTIVWGNFSNDSNSVLLLTLAILTACLSIWLNDG